MNLELNVYGKMAVKNCASQCEAQQAEFVRGGARLHGLLQRGYSLNFKINFPLRMRKLEYGTFDVFKKNPFN